MALGKAERSTRWDQALATIRAAEAARVRGRRARPSSVFRFGTRLARRSSRPFWRKPDPAQPVAPEAPGTAEAADPPRGPEPTPAPTDSDTLLTGSLETLAGRFGQAPPRAVVVFSDGRARDAARAPSDRPGIRPDEGPDPRRPGRRPRRRRRRGDRQHGRPHPGPEVDPDPGAALRPELRLQGPAGRGQALRRRAPTASPGAVLGRSPITLAGRPRRATPWPSSRASRTAGSSPPSTPSPARSRLENNSLRRRRRHRPHQDPRPLRRRLQRALRRQSRGPLRPRRERGPGGLFGAPEGPDGRPRRRMHAVVLPAGRRPATSPAGPEPTSEAGGCPRPPPSCSPTTRSSSATSPARPSATSTSPGSTSGSAGRGGGLCMVGGPNSFGSGRWADTSGRRMLPVEVDSAGPRLGRPPPDPIRPSCPKGRSTRSGTSRPTTSRTGPCSRRCPTSWASNRLGAKAKPNADVILDRNGSGSATQAEAARRSPSSPSAEAGRWRWPTGDHPPLGEPEFSSPGEEGDARYYKKFWRNADLLADRELLDRPPPPPGRDRQAALPTRRADRPDGPGLRRERRARRSTTASPSQIEPSLRRRDHLRQLPPPQARCSTHRRPPTPGPRSSPGARSSDLVQARPSTSSYAASLPIADRLGPCRPASSLTFQGSGSS